MCVNVYVCMCACVLFCVCPCSAANPLDDFGGAHGMATAAAVGAVPVLSSALGSGDATPLGFSSPMATPQAGAGAGSAGAGATTPGGTLHQRKHSHGALVPR